MSNAQYADFAISLALRAGEMMQSGRYDITIERKSDHTTVTEIDRGINDEVIKQVRHAFPDHGILGEEKSWHPERDWLWVCDPIDGTFGFITGVPISAFSLALVHQGESQLAVVFNPWTNQLFKAVKGGGAFVGDRQIHVSERGTDAPFAFIGGTGSTTDHKSPIINSAAGIEALRQRGWKAVNFPGIVYKGCLVATGQLDGTFYTYKNAHDIAAVSLIVQEAGGRVTDMAGRPQRYDGEISGAVISNGLLHDELVRYYQELS